MSVWFKSRLNPWYIWIPSNPNLYSTKIIMKMRWQTIASNVSIRTISPTATPLPKAYDCVAVYIAGRRTSLVVYGWWPQPPTKNHPIVVWEGDDHFSKGNKYLYTLRYVCDNNREGFFSIHNIISPHPVSCKLDFVEGQIKRWSISHNICKIGCDLTSFVDSCDLPITCRLAFLAKKQ